MGDLMSTEDKGGTVVQDPKSAQQPGGEDYAGMQRALNKMREGKEMPPYLVERGIESMEDLETILAKASEDKPAAKPAATGSDKLPSMPLLSQFRNQDGEPDETAHQGAMQKWAGDLVEHAATISERRASGVVTERDRITEQEALDNAAKQLPEALQDGGLGRLLIEALSVAQSGEAPASPRIIAEATERLKKVFGAATEAEVKALGDKAKTNLGGEPPNMGPGGPAASSAKEEEVPPPGSSPEVIQAWLVARLKKGQAAG
jgi:hypothetical protein